MCLLYAYSMGIANKKCAYYVPFFLDWKISALILLTTLETRKGPAMQLPRFALSVRQPWAWAIIYAGKDIENRSWQAVNHGLNVRGRIAIHAAKGMKQDEYSSAAYFMNRIGVECPPPASLTRGGIIGSVEVVDVVSESESPWFFGPRGLVLRNPVWCDPIATSGALGYFDWPSRRIDTWPEPAKWMIPNTERPEVQGSLL